MELQALMTVPEVAELWKVCDKTVFNAIRNGDLKAIRIGKSVRISREQFTAFLDSRRTETAPAVTA